jgi:outer membrane biosynthesis protein TonB
MRAIGAWLAAHKTYPEEPLQRGEEGRLAVRFTMDRAALPMLNNARLPPLPAAIQQPNITVTLQIRFTLAP